MTDAEFDLEYNRIRDDYFRTANRAELSWYSRTTRLMLQGAARRFAVKLRRIRTKYKESRVEQ